MRPLLPLLIVALLAACGADGPPVPPTKADVQSGVQISGQARVGVVGSL